MNQQMLKSLDERLAILESPAGWDYLFRDTKGALRLTLDFEGDLSSWEQLKDRCVAMGLEPTDALRLALYSFLEPASAQARFADYISWRKANRS